MGRDIVAVYAYCVRTSGVKGNGRYYSGWNRLWSGQTQRRKARCSFSRLEIFASSYCQWQIGLEVTFREKKENGKGKFADKNFNWRTFYIFIGDYITCCIVSFPPISLDYVKIVTMIKLFGGNGFSGRFLTKESRGKMREVVKGAADDLQCRWLLLCPDTPMI